MACSRAALKLPYAYNSMWISLTLLPKHLSPPKNHFMIFGQEPIKSADVIIYILIQTNIFPCHFLSTIHLPKLHSSCWLAHHLQFWWQGALTTLTKLISNALSFSMWQLGKNPLTTQHLPASWCLHTYCIVGSGCLVQLSLVCQFLLLAFMYAVHFVIANL